MSTEERHIYNERVQTERTQREADKAKRYEEASTKAQNIWERAPLINGTHPYLQKKGVSNFGLHLGYNNVLIVPILGEAGKVQSLQFIQEDGTKRFLPGGKIQGGFFHIPAKDKKTDGTLCIVEGYATGASVHMATGHAVLVAFNAGNLQHVALIARNNYSQREIILCADNDHSTDNEKNTGIEKATETAIASQAKLAVCPLVDGGKADFNDLHMAKGLEAVKEYINKAYNVGHEPLPLRKAPSQEQETYPIEALGELAKVVELITEHVSVPLPMVSASMLSVLSLCTQELANITHEGNSIPLSLYLLTIAESGERKSTVDGIVLNGIREYENTQDIIYEEKLKDWKIEQRAFEVAKRNIEKGKDVDKIKQELLSLGQEPNKPISPRKLYSNINIEGLYKVYQYGANSLGLFSDEGGILFGGTAFSNENKLKSISFLTGIWSNGRADKLRLVEGSSHISDKRLCCHIMLQPVICNTLFGDELLQEQGFFPRFLFTACKSLKGTRLKSDSPKGDIKEDEALQSFYSKCVSLLMQEVPKNEHNKPLFKNLILSKEAEIIYRNIYNATEIQQGENGELRNVSNYASRCGEQALRIAGVLTLVTDPQANIISGDIMKRASQLALWYLAEAKRLVEDGRISPDILKAEKLLKWLTAKKERFINMRNIVQNTRFGDTKTTMQILKILEAHGYIKEAPKGTLTNGVNANIVWEILYTN